MTGRPTYTDAYMTRQVESILRVSGNNDHMIGCRVRVLFELRAEDLRGRGVIPLPDHPDDPRDRS